MLRNSARHTPETLPRTVRNLRVQLTQITRTLTALERGLVEQSTPPRPPANRVSSSSCGYTLFGQEFPARNANDVLVSVLRHFAELDPDFPARYHNAVRGLGRRRPYVARDRQGVYPKRPTLAKETAEFAPGWFVGTNESNEKKLDLLRYACKAIDLPWDRDLRVRLP